MRRSPNAHFLLYRKAPKGNEWYHERCLALVDDLGVAENVIFAGFTSSPAAAYYEGDLSVLSSISEGFPYSVIEPMMCGIPVVGTNVGGVQEAVGDCGFVVEPRNPREFADACIYLMEDRARARALGGRARERALGHFTLEMCNQGFLEIYRQVTIEPRPPREVVHPAQRSVEPQRWVLPLIFYESAQ